MKILVVGLGSMGRRRVRCLMRLKADGIAGVDVRQDRREQANSAYGIVCYGDLDSALAAFEPDAVISSLPPDRHVGLARLALERGKHVFCEAGTMINGIDELIILARRAGLVAAPSCTMRFHPSIKLMKSLICAGAIGRILAFSHHVGQYLPDWHPFEDYRGFYAARRETGACREMVPFELTWLNWLMGAEPDAVTSMKGKVSDLECDIDDVYQVLLRYPGGALCHLMVDAVARAPVRATRILGADGTLEWHAQSRLLRRYDAATAAWSEHREPDSQIEPGYSDMSVEGMYVEETNAFVKACRGEAPYPHGFAEALRILKTLLAAERAAELRREPDKGDGHGQRQ